MKTKLNSMQVAIYKKLIPIHLEMNEAVIACMYESYMLGLEEGIKLNNKGKKK